MNNVKYHFHYDSSMSVDVISSLQMIKRTRKTVEIHSFVAEKKNFLQTNYNQIRDEYIKNVGKTGIDGNFMFEIDDYGETRLSEIGKKAIKIDVYRNILEFNHKKAFNWLLGCHFLNEPVEVNSTYAHDPLTGFNKQNKQIEEQLNNLKVQEYLNMSDMDKNSLADIDSDKILKRIFELDLYIDATPSIRVEILKNSLNNKDFIDQCRKYQFLYNYCNGIYNISDIQNRITDCIINNSEDLLFYKKLKELDLNDFKLFDFYDTKLVREHKLFYILKETGYKNGKSGDGVSREYPLEGMVINKEIKNYFRCIKEN